MILIVLSYAQLHAEVTPSYNATDDTVLIFDSFQEYTVGNKIAVNSNSVGHNWWTTWSNAPGSAEDGVVALMNGTKCGFISGVNDNVLLLGDEQNGNYDLEFDILVPQGKNGYFNILHHFAGSNSTWAMQCYLHLTNDGQNSTSAPGHGTIHAGSNSTADVPAVYDAWMHFRLNVNTDTDVARFYYTAPGGVEMLLCEWQWSLDSFGESTVGRTLAAMNFFAPMTDGSSEFYLDNFSFKKIGGDSAPEMLVSPTAFDTELAANDMTMFDVVISNDGNSMGDWSGWVDFGQGEDGTAGSDLMYHNGEPYTGIGHSVEHTREIAIRLTPQMYAGVAMGKKLVSVKYMTTSDAISADGHYTFRLYGQGVNDQPGELLAEKTINSTAMGSWVSVNFDDAIYLTGQEIWASVELLQAAGQYPLNMDNGHLGQVQDGNWLSTDGGVFSHCYSEGSFDGAWMITAHCEGNTVPGGWASLSKTNGSILGGQSETITLALNSIGLATGDYNSNLIINTNDVNNPHVEIPIHLYVQGINYYTITATASPSNGGTVTGGGTYAQGSSCTLTASANNGYSFVRWTKNGSQVSTNPTYTFTVTGNATYVAEFQQNTVTYTITATASPSNSGTVTGGGTYAQGASCTLTASANNGYSFVRWTKNGSQVSTNPTYTFTVTGNATYVAEFQQNTVTYTITATASPSNSGTVTGAGTYNSGSLCTLKATANSGYTFVNWTKNGTEVSTNAEYSFTVTANGSYVANFEPIQYTISASASPAAGGSVSGDGSYPAGETCTLVAQPNSGYVFEKWTENGNFVSNESAYSFTVTEDASYVAHFIESVGSYTVTAIAVPSEGGSVTGGGTYNQGATCSLKATANAGYTFVKWTEADGTLVSTDVNYTFTVTDNVIYIAVFEQNISHYTITASASPAEGGMVTGGGEYEEGTQCTLTATAFSGYRFENWIENGTVVFTQTEYSFVVNSSRTLTAVFVPIAQYTITASSSSHGSILPEGTVQVTAGEDRTFTMMPDEGYKVGSVIVDGEDVGAVETYTFRNVNGNHSIHAQFVQLGVNDLYRPELKLYPNPASSSLTIVGEDMRRVTMMDLMGGQLEDREVSCDGMTWPLDSYVSGTYIVKVEFKDGFVAFSRFVVVK